MKRSVLAAVMLLITATAFGQFKAPSNDVKMHPHQPMDQLNPRPTTTDSRGGISEMFIWYGSTEAELYGADPYPSFIWNMSNNYDDSINTGLNTVTVTYETLIAFDDNDFSSEIPWTNVINATVDTLFIQMGHENNSGLMDTVVVSIVDLNNAGRPTSNVLWTETIMTDTSFTGGANWLNSTFRLFTPNLTVNEPFGVKVEYFGAIQDTFGIVAGFWDDGQICTGTTPKALESLFAPNSYRVVSRFATAGLLPTAGGADVYYDCNANGSYDPGVDGENLQQNINFAVSMTIEDDLSSEELPSNLTAVKNFPNPFSSVTNIEYTLEQSSEVSVLVYDLTGSVIMSMNQGQQFPGTHTIEIDGSNMAEGIYYYTLNVNGGSVTKKMILTR